MRYFQKAMRRSHFPISYTGGMSPHMVMSFAAPLGIGITSEGEYMDIGLTRSIEPEEAIHLLNGAMTEGIQISSFCILDESEKSGMALVAAADYLIRFSQESKIPSGWMDRWTDFMAQQVCFVTKETKAEKREINIRPLVYRWSLPRDLTDSDGGHMIFLRTAAGSRNNLKPELVMAAFYRFADIPFTEDDIRVHRLEIYKETMENGRMRLTALDGSKRNWTEESLS